MKLKKKQKKPKKKRQSLQIELMDDRIKLFTFILSDKKHFV